MRLKQRDDNEKSTIRKLCEVIAVFAVGIVGDYYVDSSDFSFSTASTMAVFAMGFMKLPELFINPENRRLEQ